MKICVKSKEIETQFELAGDVPGFCRSSTPVRHVVCFLLLNLLSNELKVLTYLFFSTTYHALATSSHVNSLSICSEFGTTIPHRTSTELNNPTLEVAILVATRP